MKLLSLITKRPSDTQIKRGKIILGALVVLTGILAFNIQDLTLENSLLGFNLTEQAKTHLSYIIMGIGVLPIVFGGLDINIMPKGQSRIIQIFFGIFLMFVSGMFVNTATLSADLLYFFLGLFVFFMGISGKAITKAGIKYGQKITKIRV